MVVWEDKNEEVSLTNIFHSVMSLIEVKQAILAWSINCVTNNVSLGLTNENYWLDRNAGLTRSRNT